MEIKNGIMDFLSKISQTNLIDKLKLEIIIFPQLIDNLGTKGLNASKQFLLSKYAIPDRCDDSN